MWSVKGIYPGCKRTHSVLSVVSDSVDANAITKLLSIEPTSMELKRDFKRTVEITKHGWYLSTEGIVEGNDTSEHLDWLIGKLERKGNEINELQNDGCMVAVCCYWWAEYKLGTPILGPIQMHGLVDLNIPIGWVIRPDEDTE